MRGSVTARRRGNFGRKKGLQKRIILSWNEQVVEKIIRSSGAPKLPKKQSASH